MGRVLRVRRIYDPPAAEDGVRILVDRLWPRGVSKATAALHFWARAVAPSPELRRWYGHEAARWEEFQLRYRAELDANPEGVAELLAQMGEAETVTLLFASRESRHNSAVVLQAYLQALPAA